MAEKIRYEVDVDSSDAKRGLQDFSRAAKKAGKDASSALDDTASAGDKARAAIKQMADTMDTELRGAAKAAQALGDALGPELAGRTDLDQMVADLGRMGVSFDEVRADADKFADTLKQVDGVRLQQVNDGLDTTHQRLGQVRDTGDQSRSVLANMAGNAAQDLGELGGVVGTLGVGIGQLAEYAVDGNIKMSNLAAVAGPMAGLALATLGVSKAFAAMNVKEAFDAAEVERFTDALREGESAALTLFNAVAKTGELNFTNFGLLSADVDNLIPTLKELGISYSDVQLLVEQGPDAIEDYANALNVLAQNAEKAGDMDLADKYRDASDGLRQYAGNVKVANDAQEALNGWLELTPELADELFQALQQGEEPMKVMSQTWATLIDDLRDGKVDTQAAADAVLALSTALNKEPAEILDIAWQGLNETWDEATEKADEARKANEELAESLAESLTDAQAALDGLTGVDMSGIASGLQAALDVSDDFVDHLKFGEDFQHQFDDALEEARKFGPDLQELLELEAAGVTITPDITLGNLESDDAEFLAWLAGVRDMVQTGVVEAFEHGGTEAANAFARSAAQALAGARGISLADAYRLLGLPPDGNIDLIISPIIATEKLNAIQPIIDQLVSSGVLSPEIALQISALNIDDPEAALALAVQVLEAAGLEVPVQLRPDTEGFQQEMDGVTTTPWGTTVAIASNADDTKDDIDVATEDRTTQVIVPKSDSLGAMQKIIDVVARDRTVQFIAKADNAGAIDAILDAVAAPPATGGARVADILARVHEGSRRNAVATLDNVANPGGQPRTAHITVATSRSASGGGGSVPNTGGQSAPAPAGLAAAPTVHTPSAVTMAAAPTIVNNNNFSIRAGVLGNHFDVERSVTRAMRRAARINGSRAVTP